MDAQISTPFIPSKSLTLVIPVCSRSQNLLIGGGRSFATPGVIIVLIGIVEHIAARALAPNITVIMLGTNDAKSGISDTCRNDLESDYLALIDDMQNVGADVLSAHPPEIYSNTYGISNTIFWNQVIPAIENAANSAGSNIIDCNTQFQGLGSGFPLLYRSATDGVHLNRDGRELLGDLVAKYIMERAYFLELVPACNCDGSCDGDEDHSSCPQDCTTTSSSSPTSTTTVSIVVEFCCLDTILH